MSSFLRSIRDGKSFSEEQRLEAEYQKLFKKIARDFVTREDLDVILSDFVELLFETNEEFEESFEENPIDFSRKEKLNSGNVNILSLEVLKERDNIEAIASETTIHPFLVIRGL